MAQLGSGAYPTATELDADDRLVALIDGGVQEVPNSLAKSFMLPNGVVDADDVAALSGSLLAACESTTGWTSTGHYSAPTTSTNVTQGSNAVRLTPLMQTGSPTWTGYFTFSSPIAIGGHTVIAMDLRVSPDGSATVYPFEHIVAKVADDVALGGNVNTISIPDVGTDVYQTLVLPLEGLSQIKTIGFTRTGTASALSTARTNLIVDNIRFLDESKLDQALHGATTNGVIVGNYDTSTQIVPYVPADTNLLDFKRGAFSNFNGTIWLDSLYVDSTGATDVSQEIARIVNSAPSGTTIKAKVGGRYRFDQDLRLTGLNNVTVDFSGASFFLTYSQNTVFCVLAGCKDVTLKIGNWYGYRPLTSRNGSTLTTVAGTPTVNSTAIELNASGEGVRLPIPADGVGNTFFYNRGLDEQIAFSGSYTTSVAPRNHFAFTLSDSAQVTDDCIIEILDGVTAESLTSRTITLTGTPTEYWLSWEPDSLRRSLDVQVRKLTATTNTITVASSKEWNRVEYSASVDAASGVVVERSTNIEICGGDGGRMGYIEGFGADAVQASEAAVRHVHVHHIYSRGSRRQGMSFNWGADYLIENCIVGETGRSGIDVEPYAEDWTTERITVRNCEIHNAQNYIFAIANWGRNYDLRIENCIGIQSRFGFCEGGSIGGHYHNLEYRTSHQSIAQSAPSEGVAFWLMGSRMSVSNIHAEGAVLLGTHTYTVDSVVYTSTGNYITDVFFHGTTDGRPHLRQTGLTGGWDIGNVYFSGTAESAFASITGDASGVAQVDGKNFSAFHLREFNRQWPNTFKAPIAQSHVYVPNGYDNFDIPTYKMRALSGTTTKGNNLRGIGVSVTETAVTKAITFPSRTHGTAGATHSVFSTSTVGTLSSATTYYYRIGVRDRFSGPASYQAQISRTTGATQSAVGVGLRGAVNVTNGILIEGWTILRGTVNGGPYTHRYDVYPSSHFFGHGGSIDGTDLGTQLTIAAPSGSDTFWGYAYTWNVSTGSWTAVDESGYEPDATYAVQVTPSWLTTVRVTSKTTAGFTIDFGTAAPAGATVDWFIVR